jgi:hypothetical protein
VIAQRPRRDQAGGAGFGNPFSIESARMFARCKWAEADFPSMAPRFAEEIEDYLRVNGATAQVGLAAHFLKWGADDEDLRLALEWLLHEGRIERVPDREERYRLRA